jgi:hypothetical protein
MLEDMAIYKTPGMAAEKEGSTNTVDSKIFAKSKEVIRQEAKTKLVSTRAWSLCIIQFENFTSRDGYTR